MKTKPFNTTSLLLNSLHVQEMVVNSDEDIYFELIHGFKNVVTCFSK